MADNNYSTIQQHQPLRVPVSFDKHGKALVFQLDEIFDDIYRRFGRLRMEDMGKAFQNRIADDEGNISEISQQVGEIVLVVANKYDKQSGIDIKAEGIEISGSEYILMKSGTKIDIDNGADLNIKSGGDLNIKTGGVFTIDSGNFSIDASGNCVFKGTGTFSGALNAATGTFAGDLEAADGTFKVDSANKKIVIGERSSGEWTIDASGIELISQDPNNPYQFYDSRIIPISNAQGFTFYMETIGLGDATSYALTTGAFYGDINVITPYPADQHPDLGTTTHPWGTVYYDTLSQVSTRKAKHDIESLPDMGEKLDALRPVSYKYNNDPDEKTRFGLIYEDTLPVMPEICGEEAINYVELVPVLLKEVQSLRKEVQILRERVSALEG